MEEFISLKTKDLLTYSCININLPVHYQSGQEVCVDDSMLKRYHSKGLCASTPIPFA